MSAMVISNPAIDQEAATLVAKTYEAVTPHWRDTIPALTIVIADKPFPTASLRFANFVTLRSNSPVGNRKPGITLR